MWSNYHQGLNLFYFVNPAPNTWILGNLVPRSLHCSCSLIASKLKGNLQWYDTKVVDGNTWSNIYKSLALDWIEDCGAFLLPQWHFISLCFHKKTKCTCRFYRCLSHSAVHCIWIKCYGMLLNCEVNDGPLMPNIDRIAVIFYSEFYLKIY
jgi:hypothetical protein